MSWREWGLALSALSNCERAALGAMLPELEAQIENGRGRGIGVERNLAARPATGTDTAWPGNVWSTYVRRRRLTPSTGHRVRSEVGGRSPAGMPPWSGCRGSRQQPRVPTPVLMLRHPAKGPSGGALRRGAGDRAPWCPPAILYQTEGGAAVPTWIALMCIWPAG